MTTKDMLIDTLNRSEERFLDTLNQMTDAEANIMPAELIKSVNWLIWHTARMLDIQISDLLGCKALYFSQDWETRFALDLPSDTQDWMHTPKEAKKVVITDRQLLLDYYGAAMDLSRDYLENLNEASLDDIIDESYTPAVTRGVRLVSIIDDAVMHSGQAVYTRRLVIGK